MDYWKKILDDNVINSIKDAYGVSLDSILFCEYNTNSIYSSFSVLESKYCDMWNEEAIDYITNNGEKILFDQYVLRFTGYGKRVLAKKSKNGYMAKAFQECFFKNLAERILDASLSTLIFEMYLLKMQEKLKGNNEKEEYEDYNKRFLGNVEYVKELFSIYPKFPTQNYTLLSKL